MKRKLPTHSHFLILTFLLTILALPVLAATRVCIELQYTDTTTGIALITVRDDSGLATAAGVGTMTEVDVSDGTLIVDSENGLVFSELDEITFLASIPFADGTAPVSGDGVLGVRCLNTIRATYTNGEAETTDSAVDYGCDGFDVIECKGIGLIDRREINLMANTFILNSELLILSDILQNSDKVSTLKYGTTITESGWTSTLTGSYLGQPLNVSYTGLLDDVTSTDHIILTYQSAGFYGTETWAGSGQLQWDEDPVSGSPPLVTGFLTTEGDRLADKVEFGVSVGGTVGFVDISVDVSKDFATGVLSGGVSVGTGGGIASVGGGMELNQKTGANQGYVEASVLWGIVSHREYVGDKTQAYTTGSIHHDPIPPFEPDPRYDPILPTPWLNCPPPLLPDGAAPGTNHLVPGETLYDAGYIGSFTRLATDELYVEPLHLVQDGFPAIGIFDSVDLGANDVRFDMAANIAPRGHLRNDPGDSICINAIPVLEGAVFVHPPRMVYKIEANPVFDPYRSTGALSFPEGHVEAAPVIDAMGDTAPGRWCFDLPDEDFFYPGDVMQYYFETQETVDGSEILTRTLPEDLTGFTDVLGYGDSALASVYPDRYRFRALPMCYDNGFGLAQPPILVVYTTPPLDYGEGYEDQLDIIGEILGALGNLGFRSGIDYDLYAENDGGAGMGNGLGSRATPALLANYETVLYFFPGQIAHHLDEAASLDVGAYRDIELLDQWWSSGGKNLLISANHIATDVDTLPPIHRDSIVEIGKLIPAGSDIHQMVNWGSRLIGARPGNSPSTDVTLLIQDQTGSSMTCDAVEMAPGGETILDFLDEGGDPIVSTYAAGILNNDPGTGSKSVFLPFALPYASTTEPAPGPITPLAGRTVLLNDILTYFGHFASGPPVDVPHMEAFAVEVYPNPFNAKSTLVCSMPRQGRLTVRLFNTRGQLVRTLIDETVGSGYKMLSWDGRDDSGRTTASEVYLYRATALGESLTGKLNLVK